MRSIASMVAVLGLTASIARGDGGTVRWSGVSGPYRVAVLTSPEPLRVGPVDVSVVVQSAESGVQMNDSNVSIRIAPAGGDGELACIATRDASSSGLFQMASFELDRPGRWLAEVCIAAAPGTTTVATELTVAPRMPRWHDLAGWIVLPALPIALFVAREYRRARRR